jgi:hypothetical protein
VPVTRGSGVRDQLLLIAAGGTPANTPRPSSATRGPGAAVFAMRSAAPGG